MGSDPAVGVGTEGGSVGRADDHALARVHQCQELLVRRVLQSDDLHLYIMAQI